MFGGNIGSQLLYGAVMAVCLHAYGASGDLLLLGVVANTAASLLGGLSPVPGGVGPMTIAMLLENTWEAMARAEGWDAGG